MDGDSRTRRCCWESFLPQGEEGSSILCFEVSGLISAPICAWHCRWTGVRSWLWRRQRTQRGRVKEGSVFLSASRGEEPLCSSLPTPAGSCLFSQRPQSLGANPETAPGVIPLDLSWQWIWPQISGNW